MTNKEYRVFRKEIKPVLHCLDQVRNQQYYSKSNTSEHWRLLIDLHFKYIKKGKGSKECEGCKKVFKVCNDLNRLRRD